MPLTFRPERQAHRLQCPASPRAPWENGRAEHRKRQVCPRLPERRNGKGHKKCTTRVAKRKFYATMSDKTHFFGALRGKKGRSVFEKQPRNSIFAKYAYRSPLAEPTMCTHRRADFGSSCAESPTAIGRTKRNTFARQDRFAALPQRNGERGSNAPSPSANRPIFPITPYRTST